jgi:aldehyde dehydrogenase (NAD+)
VKPKLLQQLAAALRAFYGDNVQMSDDYARIVSDRHFDRVKGLMACGTVVAGGQTDAATRFIAPTVLDNVDPDSALMQEEIFGPLLPVLAVRSADEAIDFIVKRDKPLALYVFTGTRKVKDAFRVGTSSGGLVINDTMMHISFDGLPFGGVGMSGMGAYHGRHGFDNFSHLKAVLEKAKGLEMFNDVRYPPYSEKKLGMLRMLAVKGRASLIPHGWWPSLATLFIVAQSAAIIVLAVLLAKEKNNH